MVYQQDLNGNKYTFFTNPDEALAPQEAHKIMGKPYCDKKTILSQLWWCESKQELVNIKVKNNERLPVNGVEFDDGQIYYCPGSRNNPYSSVHPDKIWGNQNLIQQYYYG